MEMQYARQYFVQTAEISDRRTFLLHFGEVRFNIYGRVKSRGIYALLKTHNACDEAGCGCTEMQGTPVEYVRF